MEKQSIEGKRRKHLVSVALEPKTITDWSVPYIGCRDAGRGIFEIDDLLTDIIVRYYSFERVRFEKKRHFAEIIVNKKEKFIIDGVEHDELIRHVTETVGTILECRKRMRQANTTLKRIK